MKKTRHNDAARTPAAAATRSTHPEASGTSTTGEALPNGQQHIQVPAASDDALFGRVASILEQARGNVVRAVNHNMVVAYWSIGREIVTELQRGQDRAEYGDALMMRLSSKMTSVYGNGFSYAAIKNFKQFYLAYGAPRMPGTANLEKGREASSEKGYTLCSQLMPEFSRDLTWSHYRALMRVTDLAARRYYEDESVAGNWSVRVLERQIHAHSFERLLSTRGGNNADGMLISALPGSLLDALKDPYVLEFLDIPDPAALHESGLEGAIIAHLRDFLLELGKGFAFVARQKRLSFDGDDLYVDLVFYNWMLKCFLLIDLKMGRLTAGDVGQMDSYVRMFDDLVAGRDDNPTIGLILCTQHNNAVARYSVLNDHRQIFASRYVTCLPTEAELAAEIQRSRAQIEGRGVKA